MATKIQSKDIKNKAFLTTGTSPNYEVTIARETSYADMDRQKFTVNFHAAGTGVITLNINGLLAKTIDTDAVAADEYMELIYDLSQDKFIIESRTQDTGGTGGEGAAFVGYRPGENVDAGDYLFVEDGTTFIEATEELSIGNIENNKRFHIPFIGNGITGNQINLSLAKYGAPTDDLGVRIETDTAGKPSGTLLDANAVFAVLESSLTTGLTDETITSSGSFTPLDGIKYHIVMFQGTYGSETIDQNGFYKIGFIDKNTTTRDTNAYDGTSWTDIEQAYPTTFEGVVFDSTYWDTSLVNTSECNNGWRCTEAAVSAKNGILVSNKIYTEENIFFASNRDNGDYYNENVNYRMSLYKDANNKVEILRARSGSSSPTSTFEATLTEGGVVTDTWVGSTPDFHSHMKLKKTGIVVVVQMWNGSAWVDQHTFVTNPATLSSYVVRGELAGSNSMSHGYRSNVYQVSVALEDFTTLAPSIYTDFFLYTSSNLFVDSILSKTDSTYEYKIARLGVSLDTVGVGTKPSILLDGVDANQTGMTIGDVMYLTTIPGAVDNVPGINKVAVGTAISDTEIFLGNAGGNTLVDSGSYSSPDGITNTYLYTIPMFGYLTYRMNGSASSGNTYHWNVELNGRVIENLTSAVAGASGLNQTNQRLSVPVNKGDIIDLTLRGATFTYELLA